MKASEARDLSREERKQKVVELAEVLFNLRFQHEISAPFFPITIPGREVKTLSLICLDDLSISTFEMPAW